MSFDPAWARLPLKAVGVELIDCDHRTPAAAPDGIPYIAIPQLRDGHIVLDGVRRISEADYAEWTKKLTPKTDDVVIVRRCNSGDSAHVPAGMKCAIGQNLVVLRANGSKVLPQYLRWLVRGNEWWDEVGKYINVGAVFDSLRCRDIPNFELPIPPLDAQREISRVLAALDDRITLLRETNATLEAIAQALFKSWFVDFDPVRAKMEGRAPEGMDEATAALFPDSLEETELGVVPRGWRVAALQDCCNKVESGGTPKRTVPEFWSGSISWLTSGEVRNPIVFDTKEKITASGVSGSSAKLWPAGTTVVAMYGATAGEACLIASPMTANQACCGLIPQPDFRAFLFFCTRRERKILASKSSGSAQQNLNKGLVEKHPIIRPTNNVAAVFEAAIGSLLDRWIESEKQAQTLSTLRDTLLPRLISGQLRVAEVPATVEKAFA